MTPSSKSLALIRWSKPGIIYVARNRVNGKLYVGLTTCGVKGRMKTHKAAAYSDPKTPFERAIAKYKMESFDFLVVQECANAYLVREAEIWWISCLDTIRPKGYNRARGGTGGFEWDQESREKLSASHRGKKHSPEHVKNQADALRGKKVPKLQGRVAWNLGVPMSEETKTNIRQNPRGFIGFLGKHHTEESKKKLSDAKKGKPCYKRRGISTNKGRKWPPGSRKVKDQWGKKNAMYGRSPSEEQRKALGDRVRGKKQTPEQVRKRMEARLLTLAMKKKQSHGKSGQMDLHFD